MSLNHLCLLSTFPPDCHSERAPPTVSVQGCIHRQEDEPASLQFQQPPRLTRPGIRPVLKRCHKEPHREKGWASHCKTRCWRRQSELRHVEKTFGFLDSRFSTRHADVDISLKAANDLLQRQATVDVKGRHTHGCTCRRQQKRKRKQKTPQQSSAKAVAHMDWTFDQ
jgi:hypothetical protein